MRVCVAQLAIVLHMLVALLLNQVRLATVLSHVPSQPFFDSSCSSRHQYHFGGMSAAVMKKPAALKPTSRSRLADAFGAPEKAMIQVAGACGVSFVWSNVGCQRQDKEGYVEKTCGVAWTAQLWCPWQERHKASVAAAQGSAHRPTLVCRSQPKRSHSRWRRARIIEEDRRDLVPLSMR